MDQYIGKLLDNRYEILERIGSGGMAVVYKARCHRLNRLVAIKILKSDLAQDAEFRRRFHDESQAVAMLSHPNIVAVYDVSRSDQLDYIVMELIDGITLKQYMQKKGDPLNWREALHFITQIMKALSHAHSRGIIHRDIKPHNIMVLRDGSVKVADFGIARLASAAQNTLTQEALGSVHYISPEQARGSHIDARSDLYSAGVVLYEMITGRLPYEGDSPISVAIQHINSIPLSPREVNPEIPEAMEAITMKAMSAKVEQRYASADVMLVDLEEFRKNPNINFEYTAADLLTGADEPTQVMDTTGSHNFRGSAPATGDQAHATVRKRRREEPEETDDPNDGYDDRSRRRSGDKGSSVPTIAAIGAILVFLLAIGYFLWVIFANIIFPSDDGTYIVPDFTTGMTIEEAQANKELLGPFTIEQKKVVLGTDAPEGQIVSQDPKAGTSVKSGSLIIKVEIVGSNSDGVIMEDYTNKPSAVVKATLTGKGILVDVKEEPSETVTREYIISQAPIEGTPVKPGETVTLVVSTGPEVKEFPMISLLGATQAAAEEQLKALKLILGVPTAVFDAAAPVGTVIWQSVDPGINVPENKVIDIKVSKGPDPAVTPSPDPSQSPSASPSPSPSPSSSPSTSEQPGPATVSKIITVKLPEDRDIVSVIITVNGKEVYNKQDIETIFRKITPTISGSGMAQEVCVYIDGALTETLQMDFVK